ncbi:MAG: DUF4468 domain-containing protein [Bacteroidetes bacterium]|nr:DUF4468 domain-containing protein [Bacteroidota bacterium]
MRKHVFLAVSGFFFLGFLKMMAGQTVSSSDTIVPVDPDTRLIVYQEVVYEEGTKNDFFNRAVNWINKTYKNPSGITSVRDPQTGKIEGSYRFRIYTSNNEGINMDWGTILYSFKLEFKDGRYRYTFDNFLLQAQSSFPLERWLDKNDPVYNETCDPKLMKVDEQMKDLIASLKKFMKPPPAKKDDNW